MNQFNKPYDHEAVFARMRADMQAQRDRAERAEERAIERMRLDMTSLGQQFTGMSVICTFVSSMMVALLQFVGSSPLDGGHIYLMWYLALIYSLTTAIASGTSAVIAFARANGNVDEEVQKRANADRLRMMQLMRGFGVCLTIAVGLQFTGLLFFVWAAHDRWLIMTVTVAVLPLWVWSLWQAYREWRSVVRGAGAEGTWWRLWNGAWSSWSASRSRREEKDREKEKVKEKEKEDV